MTTPTFEQSLLTPDEPFEQIHASNGTPSGSRELFYRLCPHLGTATDAETAYNFPAERNHCYQVKPATSVQLPHQINYCLSPNYLRCPLYRHQEVVDLAKRRKRQKLRWWRPKSGHSGRPRTKRALIRLIPILFFAAAALLLVAGWYYRVGIAAWLPPTTSLPAVATNNPLPSPTGERVAVFPSATNTPTATPSPTPTNTPIPTKTPTRRPSATPSPTPSPTSATGTAEPLVRATITAMPTTAGTGCPPPDGWILHIVESGDSLFRLGQRFGVPYADLQAANCMGSSKQIYVGQHLYVPDPSPTITAEPTDSLPVEVPAFSPGNIDN